MFGALGRFIAGGMQAVSYGPSDPVSAETGWFVRLLGGGKTNAGPIVTEHSAFALPVVYACMNRIANPVARFPVEIRRRKANGRGSDAVDGHPLSGRIGARPNEFMSSKTYRKAVQVNALGWGNGFSEIERNGRGQAVNLWPLLSDRTAPVRRDDTLRIRTTVGGKNFEIAHGDVLQIMDISLDGYVGMSPIAMARQAIGMALAMEEFGGKFFANDAKSGGFLMHPGKLSPKAKTNIRAANGERLPNPENPGSQLEAQSGLDNAHRVKVLEEGMKFVSTTIPPEDAQFLGSREFQIAEIARIFDVPLVLLQSHEKSTSWGSGIEQLMIGFVRQTIDPWVNAWEQEMSWKLFTEEERGQGYFVKFNMNALLRGDMAARADFYTKLFSLAGLTIDDILELEDMQPVGGELGATRFVSTNLQTLEAAIAASTLADDPEPEGGAPAAPPPPPRQEPAQ